MSSSWLFIYPWQIPWFWTALSIHITPNVLVAQVPCCQDSITLIHNFSAIHRPSSKQLPVVEQADIQRLTRNMPTASNNNKETPKIDLWSQVCCYMISCSYWWATLSPQRWAHQKGWEQPTKFEVDSVCQYMLFLGIHVVADDSYPRYSRRSTLPFAWKISLTLPQDKPR